MNIFLTSPDPSECARGLDDKRLVKMVLETAQLLSSACHMLKLDVKDVYKNTHYNHPCAVFTRKSLGNFKWLVEHGLELSKEFEHRFCHTHKSEAVITRAYNNMREGFEQGKGLTSNGWMTSLTFSFNCSGFDTGDVHEDYKLCMRKKWMTDKSVKWSCRKQPEWR